jgi:hypothetical protein
MTGMPAFFERRFTALSQSGLPGFQYYGFTMFSASAISL